MLRLLILAPFAFAQTPSPTTFALIEKDAKSSPATTSKPTSVQNADHQFSFSSSSSYAPFNPDNGNGNGNGNSNNNNNSGGMSTYYLAGLILILACLALAVFFMFRRRAQAIALRRRTGNRAEALQRDLASPDSHNGRTGFSRYTRGLRRGGIEDTGEEGLNELGEAPPAYIAGENRRPAMPLQTLSREDVGLKPPDYSETSTYEVDPNARDSTASASSARAPEHPPAST